MAKYQLQLHQLMPDGTDVYLYPINTALDVNVGKLSAGSLTLPGNSDNEILAQTLANIKKYLTNLSDVAANKMVVSDSITSTSSFSLATSKAVNDVKVRTDSNFETIAEHTTQIDGKAPIEHASEELEYGGGTERVYGHVRVSDVHTNLVKDGDASHSVAASQNALFNVFKCLHLGKAETKHALSDSSRNGGGTSELYGHVKLSDVYEQKITDGAADNSVGASQNALYEVYSAVSTDLSNVQALLAGKAPVTHSSDTSQYGAGTNVMYGHVKLSDDYDKETANDSLHSVGASSFALYRAYSALSNVCAGKLASTHANEKATSTKFSHVCLSDAWTSSSGAASSGVAASSYAVFGAYDALSKRLSNVETSYIALTNKTSELNASLINKTSKLEASGEFNGDFGFTGTACIYNSDGLGSRNVYIDFSDDNQPHYTSETVNGYMFTKNRIAPTIDAGDSFGMNLGGGSFRWKQLYVYASTIATSDRNKKHNISDISTSRLEMMLNINPKQYMLNGGDRIHTGVIAQDVEDLMKKFNLSSEDVGMFCKDIDIVDGVEKTSYGIRYEEMISPILNLVQILWKEVFGSLTLPKK